MKKIIQKILAWVIFMAKIAVIGKTWRFLLRSYVYFRCCVKVHGHFYIKILQMSNGCGIFRSTVCCPFAHKRLTDISVNECSCAQLVQGNIFAQIVNRIFVQKTVDEYFGRPFAVRMCTLQYAIKISL